MKKLPKILPVFLFAMSFGLLQSCQQECDCSKASVADGPQRSGEASLATSIGGVASSNSFRTNLILGVKDDLGKIKSVPTFKYDPKMFDNISPEDLAVLNTDDTKPQLGEKGQNAQAVELVASIFNSMLGAENEQAQLNVQLLLSEEEVKDGMLLFSLRSEEAQDLNFKIYDEEGFQTVANNTMSVNAGENYKALNVASLPNGSYLFKLRNDDTRKEMIRKVTINNN